MTQIDYGMNENLNEYFLNYSGSKVKLFKDIARACNVSMMTAERWCRFYYKADEKYWAKISEVTGIEQKALFNGF